MRNLPTALNDCLPAVLSAGISVQPYAKAVPGNALTEFHCC